MYNRYVPQPDGSFRRNRIPEVHRPPAPKAPSPPPEKVCPPEPKPIPNEPCQRKPETVPCAQPDSFLRRLLPKDFDTGDLIVILLILLMAGDCQEDQNTALLTLAIYLFL
jgi:hypothetical protein